MARHYRVNSKFDAAFNGRILIELAGESDHQGCSLSPVDELEGMAGNYLCEITHRDGHTMGWEMTNADEFFRLGWGRFEGPRALLFDPVYAPEGAQLKDLFRRVYEHRAQTPIATGIGAA